MLDRVAVNAAYTAATSAGAEDNGSLGVHLHYDPGYNAASMLDQMGIAWNLSINLGSTRATSKSFRHE